MRYTHRCNIRRKEIETDTGLTNRVIDEGKEEIENKVTKNERKKKDCRKQR